MSQSLLKRLSTLIQSKIKLKLMKLSELGKKSKKLWPGFVKSVVSMTKSNSSTK